VSEGALLLRVTMDDRSSYVFFASREEATAEYAFARSLVLLERAAARRDEGREKAEGARPEESRRDEARQRDASGPNVETRSRRLRLSPARIVEGVIIGVVVLVISLFFGLR
jgi:hypothetical protein